MTPHYEEILKALAETKPEVLNDEALLFCYLVDVCGYGVNVAEWIVAYRDMILQLHDTFNHDYLTPTLEVFRDTFNRQPTNNEFCWLDDTTYKGDITPAQAVQLYQIANSI
jgi:hypothetical protein